MLDILEYYLVLFLFYKWTFIECIILFLRHLLRFSQVFFIY